MDSALAAAAEQAGCRSSVARSLALEYLRRLAMKAQGGLGKDAAAAPAACLELACRTSGASFDRAALERVCGVPRLRYAPFVTRIGNLLGVCSDAKSFGMEAYAVRFGVDGVGAPAKRLFAAFVRRFTDRLPAADRPSARFAPVHSAAAFYTVCRATRRRVDLCKLCEAVNVRKSELLAVCEVMQELCAELIESMTPKKPIRAGAGGGGSAAVAAGGSAAAAAAAPSRAAAADASASEADVEARPAKRARVDVAAAQSAVEHLLGGGGGGGGGDMAS